MIFIDAKWYPEPEFAAKMREFGERASSKDVLIKADKQLVYGDVKKVMRMIKDAGFEKIGLITERKAEK
jgi:biopolymer transport protein TolR